MVWHAKNTSTDGLVRHHCDSKAWKHVHKNVDSSFGQENRNIHLGMAADGVPFKVATYKLEYMVGNVIELQHTPMVDYEEIFHNVGIANPRKKICDISIL